jgi:hypothetical protein
MTTYVQTLSSTSRLPNSRVGNPKHRIRFTDGTYAETQTDAGVAYGLENPENFGKPALVRATPAGRVWDVQPIDVDATYAVHYVTNKRTHAYSMVGIVPGSAIPNMVLQSADPDRLRFVKDGE